MHCASLKHWAAVWMNCMDVKGSENSITYAMPGKEPDCLADGLSILARIIARQIQEQFSTKNISMSLNQLTKKEDDYGENEQKND